MENFKFSLPTKRFAFLMVIAMIIIVPFVYSDSLESFTIEFFTVSEDSIRVRSQTPDTNSPGTITIGQSGGDLTRSYIRFPFPQSFEDFKVGVKDNFVNMTVNLTGGSPAGTIFELEFYSVDDEWDKNNVTWNNQPCNVDPINTSVCTLIQTINFTQPLIAPLVTSGINITSLFVDAVNNDRRNVSFMIKLVVDASGIQTRWADSTGNNASSPRAFVNFFIIYDFNITILDTVTGQNNIIDVTAGNNPEVLFGTLSQAGTSSLVAYNISNSSAISIISSFAFESSTLGFLRPRRVEVDINDVAYISFATNNSFAIMNVSNPASMTILGNLTGTGTLNGARNHKVIGDIVYLIAGNDNAFNIINVSDSRHPFIMANLTGAGSPNFLDFAWDIDVQGNFAFVASGSDVGVTIIDITDNRNPVVINHTPVGQAGFGEFFTDGLSVRGNLLAVDTCDFDGSETVTLLDVTNPASPIILDSISSTQLGGADFLACGNDFVFSDVEGFTDILFHISSQDDAVTLIDISDTSNIKTVGVIEGAGSPNFLGGANQMELIGDKIYVASFNDNTLTSYLWIQPPPLPVPAVVEELPLSRVVQIGGMIVLLLIILNFLFKVLPSGTKK